MSGGAEITQAAEALLIKPLVVESLTELPDGATPQVGKPIDPLTIIPVFSKIEISDNLPVPISIASQDPPLYEILSEILTFSSEEKEFWWHTTAPLLNTLLQSAGYSFPLQRQYLSFFEEYIIPFLGPTPLDKSRWRSILTPSSIPFEATLSAHSRTSASSIKFRIEPIGQANSPPDPFNQLAPDGIVSFLSRDEICLNLEWDTFNYFADEFFVRGSDVEKLVEASRHDDTMTSSMFMRFDLDKSTFDPKLQAFFFPASKAQLTGLSQSKPVFEAVRKLHDKDVKLLFALEMLDNCLQSHKDDEIVRPKIGCISVDCTSPVRGPISIHAHSSNSSFSHVREIYTLGESLNSRTVWSGLQELEDLWGLLYALRYHRLPTASWAEEEIFPQSSDGNGCIQFVFELTSESNVPAITVRIPIWVFERKGSDAATAAVTNFFNSRRCELPCGGDLDEVGTLTHFSFKYAEEKGISVGMSYEPKMDS